MILVHPNLEPVEEARGHVVRPVKSVQIFPTAERVKFCHRTYTEKKKELLSNFLARYRSHFTTKGKQWSSKVTLVFDYSFSEKISFVKYAKQRLLQTAGFNFLTPFFTISFISWFIFFFYLYFFVLVILYFRYCILWLFLFNCCI